MDTDTRPFKYANIYAYPKLVQLIRENSGLQSNFWGVHLIIKQPKRFLFFFGIPR